MLNYGIMYDGEIIAEFKNEKDRDYCYDLLSYEHDDGTWKKVDI